MAQHNNQVLFGIAAVFAFPILLVHGYAEDTSVFNSWTGWLSYDNFENVYSVTFGNDDQCGSVKHHAVELDYIVDQVLHYSGDDQVNIVAHSKGVLDARMYIAENPGKVANLVMIAGPNEGTPAAYVDLTSCAGSHALLDLQPGSAATKTPDQNSTNYWAVAGNDSSTCFFTTFRPMCYVVPNDGFVEVESALSNYTSLGTFPYSHNQLLTEKDVYQTVLPKLR